MQHIRNVCGNLASIKKFICRVIATVFFIGNVPYMPGTVASFVTACIVFFMPLAYTSPEYFIYGMVIFFLLVIGVLSSACLERLDQKIDPAYVVIDEVVGMLITLWGIQHSFWWFAGAFCLFRFFDISKIFPICVIERHVPGGWGMMLDDVVAGFFSLIVLRLMMLVFPC